MVIVDRKVGHSGGSLTLTLPRWFVKFHNLQAKDSINVHYNIDNTLTIAPLVEIENETEATKIKESTC